MRFPRFTSKTHRQVERYKSGAMRWVMMPVYVLGAFFNSIGTTVASWWNRRNLRYLLQGLPALFVFVGIVVVATFCIFQDRAVLAKSYQIEATKSLAEAESMRVAKRDSNKPLALAQSYYNRLTTLQPDNQENRYLLALSYLQRAFVADTKARAADEKLKATKDPAAKDDAQKEFDTLRDEVNSMQAATLRMMTHLAPSDKRGYGRAHLWMVDNLYRFRPGPDGKLQPPSPKVILEIERHLLHALSWPEDQIKVGAHLGLARLYFDAGRRDEAKKHLIEVASRQPEFRLTLAKWAKAEGDNDSILAHARAAENVYRTRLTTNADNHEARLGVVECLLMQSRFADAELLINEGATLGINTQEIRTIYAKKLTELLLAWSDAKKNDPKSNFLERLLLLERALAMDTENPDTFARLLAMAKEKTPQSEKAREALHDLTKNAQNSVLAHLFLGIDAWEHKNDKEARYHWEKALELSPRAPVVLNNLAWLLAFTPPVDLNRALQLAEAAVEKAPQAAQFRGTRGHIYAKLGRNKEALADLQESAKAYPNDPNLFRTMADVATKLEFNQMAEQYKKEAERLSGLAASPLGPTNPIEKKPDAPGLVPPVDSKGAGASSPPPTGNPPTKPPL